MPASDEALQVERNGVGVGHGCGSEPEPLGGRLDEEEIAVQEHPEVRRRLEVARKRLLDAAGKAGQRRPDRRIVVLGVVERATRIPQRQPEDGQVVEAPFEVA